MILVSMVYECIPRIICDICDHRWTGIIETDQIDWGNGNVEVRMVQEAECPECGNMTIIKRTGDPNIL